jgi:hypothetical protein
MWEPEIKRHFVPPGGFFLLVALIMANIGCFKKVYQMTTAVSSVNNDIYPP